MRIGFVLFLCLMAVTSVAKAEPIPDYVLDKDFVACMGGENAQQDAERGQYCQCIRDNMKNWSLESYTQLALQESKASDAAQMPQELQGIAKACIAKVLH